MSGLDLCLLALALAAMILAVIGFAGLASELFRTWRWRR